MENISELKLRANSDDEIFKNHLVKSATIAQYTSANTQNMLIEICGPVINEKIINNINRTSFFFL